MACQIGGLAGGQHDKLGFCRDNQLCCASSGDDVPGCQPQMPGPGVSEQDDDVGGRFEKPGQFRLGCHWRNLVGLQLQPSRKPVQDEE